MTYDRKLLQNIQAASDLIPKQMYKDRPLTLEALNSTIWYAMDILDHLPNPWAHGSCPS